MVNVYNVVYPSLVEEKYLRQAVLRSALSEAYTMKSTLLERLFPEEYEPEENFTETLKESGRTLLWPPKQNTISEPKEDKTIEPFLQGDIVHIPLKKLFHVPKVKELCGSLDVLRKMLDGEPTFNHDRDAILYPLD
ncbi:small RNA 2'-O-methyltransferase-like [Bombina bombina]|uniref:small RNA 2'-O-methyltransferase-like n=1 Tax=Bombina bombina TaxID=8345 RepID=UPI00235A901B|nr:small RNA 2'-O-methyltransferase-like [Bombina bombina]